MNSEIWFSLADDNILQDFFCSNSTDITRLLRLLLDECNFSSAFANNVSKKQAPATGNNCRC